jgi:hypothetical protein
VRRSCRASPSWRRCLGPSDPVIYNVTPSSSSPSCGPHVSSRSLRCSDHRQVRERLFSSRFRRTRHYSAANCFIKVRGADHHARRPRRSSRSWHRTQHCTSGMACSRAGEIDSPHSPQVPYSPSLSCERRREVSSSSRVTKPMSRLSLAWIASPSREGFFALRI